MITYKGEVSFPYASVKCCSPWNGLLSISYYTHVECNVMKMDILLCITVLLPVFGVILHFDITLGAVVVPEILGAE